MDPGSSPRIPPPKINTSLVPSTSAGGLESPSYALFDHSPTSATPNIPPLQKSVSSNETRHLRTGSDNGPTSRAKSESRKLLTHVLLQLQNRRRPPHISQNIIDFGHDVTTGGMGKLADFMRGVSATRSTSKSASRTADPDGAEGSDDEEDGIFSTETTFDLMNQLQNLLAMSLSLGWKLFDDDHSDPGDLDKPKEKERTSRFRRSRNSFQPGTKIPRSPSPSHGDSEKREIPNLLALCISVLSSVITEDCRFQIVSHRPSRPPNSLQVVTLNVAQFLINSHRHEPQVISQVGFAVIPAFSTFQREMHGRLMIFFQDVIIRGLLETLHRSQRLTGDDDTSAHITSPTSPLVNMNRNGPQVQIQIDNVDSEPLDAKMRVLAKIQSSNAPHQPPAVYYLSSLVAPLLAAVLEAIDVTSLPPTHELAVRFFGLMEIVASLKVDAYNDLLQIAAYHSPLSRKSACSLLATLWPKIIGHATISQSLPIPLSLDFRQATIPWLAHRGHTHHHQFIPWQFNPKLSCSNFDGVPEHSCSFCSVVIHGFGILCPFCMCAVHFDCYDPPGGTLMQQYTMAQDASAQRVAMLRVSPVIPNGGEPSFRHNGHNFELVTVFTLCLCYLCHQPLWGCVAQGAQCSTCAFIAHTSCLVAPSIPYCGHFQLDSKHMTVEHRALRRSALAHFPELRWTDEQLAMLAFEELVIIYDNLRTQLELITNGIALNSIIVKQENHSPAHGNDFSIEEFELHRVLDRCKRLISSTSSPRSPATIDYMDENRILFTEHSILYDFSNLVYLSTAMKSPISSVQNQTASPSADLLNLPEAFDADGPPAESISAHPYEAVPLSHMRDILNVEFNIHRPLISNILLNHLFHLSFFERLDPREDITSDPIANDALCVFPLPLGLDMSTDVETLVCSIETCLTDLDLSVNEFAFLLLVRKFWPNGLMSDYGLRRLARSVLTWIIVEDDNLATILRDYVAKQKPLPGVRKTGDLPPWPFAHSARGMTDVHSSNGRDYMSVRTALLTRYAIPWLLSLHDQDEDTYTDIVYDTCTELADDKVVGSEVYDGCTSAAEENALKRLDVVLFSLFKIIQASATFSCTESLSLRWLGFVTDLGIPAKPVNGLHRLFPRDNDTINRQSSLDPDLQGPGTNEPALTIRGDPFSALLQVAEQSPYSMTQVMNWLILISRSGIEISATVFEQFITMVIASSAAIEHGQALVHALVLCIWQNPVGRLFFQPLLGRLHAAIGNQLVAALKGTDPDLKSASLSIVRNTLGSCALIYGCDRVAVAEAGLLEDAVRDLGSRRKQGQRVPRMDDPVVVEPEILQGVAQYLRLDDHDITSWIAKFLNLFFTASPFVAPYEVDNFILKNGPLMAECAWKFYGIQRHDLSSLRQYFLLRIMVVDAEPFQNLIDGGLHPDLHWERRLLTINRLSRILMDVTSPSFNIDGRQWRASVGEILISYFSMIWSDAEEDIRLSVRVIVNGLLPAQIEAVAQCWNEALSTAPMSDKIRLISFLIQLRPHLPGWGLISWTNLIETMGEYDSGVDGDTSALYSMLSPQGDLESKHLVVSALMLIMLMVADGVPIDAFALLNVKIHAIRLFGFQELTITPSQDPSALPLVQYGGLDSIPEVALPCIEPFVAVVDASHTMDMPASIWGAYQEYHLEDKTMTVLVGHIFVDIILNLIGSLDALESLPVAPLKNLLEATYIILHKNDFDVQPARSLQPLLRKAMDKIIELAPKNINYEVRQLSLTVVQAFCKRCFSLIRVGQTVFTILENVTEVIFSLNHQSQDALVVQGKSLIHSLLSAHTNVGLMINIFMRPQKEGFFIVLKQVLGSPNPSNTLDSEPLASLLWRDAVIRASECDATCMQTVIHNLGKFVQTVHYEEYSSDMLNFTGQQVASIMRRLSDSSFDSVDSSPLLAMLARLSKTNRKNSRDLLPYIETTLRVALTRGSVTAPSLIQLVNATQQRILEESTPLGRVVSTLVEILSDSLRLKARVLPTTLNAIIECLTSNEIPIYPEDSTARFKLLMNNLIENGCYFLDNHVWLDAQTENDFNVSLTVARIIFQALEQDPTSSRMEVSYRLVNSLRSWVILAIVALQDDTRQKWVLILFQHLDSFSNVYLSTMRTYAQSNLSSDSAASDINQAYIAAKVWLMLAQRVSNLTGMGDGPMLRVWNDVWPVFESIIDGLEVEARAGLSSTLLVLASATVADLLVFIRSLRSPLALDVTGHIDILNRLKAARGEDAKVTRAIRAIYEAPAEMSGEFMLEQIAKEVTATEKMKNIEAKRDVGRVGFRKESAR